MSESGERAHEGRAGRVTGNVHRERKHVERERGRVSGSGERERERACVNV